MNLGKLLDVVEDKRKSDRCTETIFVSELSEGARVRLLERLTKVRDGYKELLKEYK